MSEEPIDDAILSNSYIHTDPPAEDCPARFDIENGDFEKVPIGKYEQCTLCFPQTHTQHD